MGNFCLPSSALLTFLATQMESKALSRLLWPKLYYDEWRGKFPAFYIIDYFYLKFFVRRINRRTFYYRLINSFYHDPRTSISFTDFHFKPRLIDVNMLYRFNCHILFILNIIAFSKNFYLFIFFQCAWNNSSKNVKILTIRSVKLFYNLNY